MNDVRVEIDRSEPAWRARLFEAAPLLFAALAFAAGARARSDSWSTCEAMLDATFYVSGSGGKSSRGWADGQRVAWANHLAHALQSCYLDGGR